MGRRRRAALIAGLWAFGTVVALVITLPAVQPDKDFDGLNNMLQIPFALPWFLLPTPALTGNDHVVDAWITAGWGLLNSGIIYWWLGVCRSTR